MKMSADTIGVIGLGLMGTPISRLLMKAGYNVVGFDINNDRMATLEREGLRAVATAKDVAINSDMVFLSLPNWNVVVHVMEAEQGVIAGAKTNQLIIDLSTSPPWETRKMASKLDRMNIRWMDAPISGSSAQARAGDIVFLVGGRMSDYEELKEVLYKIAKKTVYAGENGSGDMLKLAVNHTLFLNEAAAIEGMVLALKAGIEPKIILEALTSGAASSNLIEARGSDMLGGNFTPKGQLSICVKDLALSLEAARNLGIALPIGSQYHQIALQSYRKNLGDYDATIVIKEYEEMKSSN